MGQRTATAELRKGALEFCVLALLCREDRYGFDLVRTLSSVDGLATSEGTIYPLLSRLKKEGTVSTIWRDSDTGPPRKYYSITSQGRLALGAFRDEWKRFSAALNTLLDDSEAGEQ